VSLIAFREQSAQRIDFNIEQLLAALKPFAFVVIFNSDDDDTWNAKAKMRIKTEGAQFSVYSDFKHPTCKAALEQLLTRVEQAVKDLSSRA
jgi:hypothetical protein